MVILLIVSPKLVLFHIEIRLFVHVNKVMRMCINIIKFKKNLSFFLFVIDTTKFVNEVLSLY